MNEKVVVVLFHQCHQCHRTSCPDILIDSLRVYRLTVIILQVPVLRQHPSIVM